MRRALARTSAILRGSVGAVCGVANVDDAFVRQLVHDGASYGEAPTPESKTPMGAVAVGATGAGLPPGVRAR